MAIGTVTIRAETNMNIRSLLKYSNTKINIRIFETSLLSLENELLDILTVKSIILLICG